MFSADVYAYLFTNTTNTYKYKYKYNKYIYVKRIFAKTNSLDLYLNYVTYIPVYLYNFVFI